jgi:hypothetical protein
MLNEFCAGVQRRMGSTWTDLLTTFLPVVLEMIQSCFNSSQELADFAEGKRSNLQLAGLRNKCRRVVRERGVRGIWQVAKATDALYDATLAELDATANRAMGTPDVYEQAFNEAMSV